MELVKLLTVIIMVGMIAKALWTLLMLGRTILKDREKE